MKPHTNPRNGAIFLILGVVLLGHSLLSSSALWGQSLPGTLPPLWMPLLFWAGLAYTLLGWAYLRGVVGVYGKRANGTVSPLLFCLMLPIRLQNYLGLFLVRRLSSFTVFHEVAPGLYLGGLAFGRDAQYLRQAGVFAVLDLTAEFAETVSLRREINYHCLPLLNATAPTRAELEAGARWIQQARDAGNLVYVHCAKGAGRSATFATAYLILSGQASDMNDAVRQLRERRRHVKLFGTQTAVLADYGSVQPLADGVIR